MKRIEHLKKIKRIRKEIKKSDVENSKVKYSEVNCKIK